MSLSLTISMIKNNYKNTILTSMIALTLLTSVIAAGGIQNAYAGDIENLDCTIDPDILNIELAAGEDFELPKQITCVIPVDFRVDVAEFEVFHFSTICDDGVEVGLTEPSINVESLVADYDEIILVLGDTVPGEYQCEIQFEAEVQGKIFFCDLDDFIGPLTVDEINECDSLGGEIQEAFFFASAFGFKQEILVEVPESEILVHIDIKPESCPNPINPNSKGLLPVAILGSADFDVSQIDVETITIGLVSPVKDNIADVATPHNPVTGVINPNDCSTEGPDGIDDLTLKFDMQEIVVALGLDIVPRGTVAMLVVTGNLIDGTPFEGYDLALVR